MPDPAAEPAESEENRASEAASPPAGAELAALLSKARQHPRFLYWLSVPGQQELRTRLEPPRPPKGPLLIFFIGVPMSILGVFIHTSVALTAMFAVAIAFIVALFRLRAANMQRLEAITFQPAAGLVEDSADERALVCAFQPESPCHEWRGLPVSAEDGRALVRLPRDARMAALKAGDPVVFVAHEGRVLAIEAGPSGPREEKVESREEGDQLR